MTTVSPLFWQNISVFHSFPTTASLIKLQPAHQSRGSEIRQSLLPTENTQHNPLIPSLNSMSRHSLIARKGCQSKQLSNRHTYRAGCTEKMDGVNRSRLLSVLDLDLFRCVTDQAI